MRKASVAGCMHCIHPTHATRFERELSRNTLPLVAGDVKHTDKSKQILSHLAFCTGTEVRKVTLNHHVRDFTVRFVITVYTKNLKRLLERMFDSHLAFCTGTEVRKAIRNGNHSSAISSTTSHAASTNGGNQN